MLQTAENPPAATSGQYPRVQADEGRPCGSGPTVKINAIRGGEFGLTSGLKKPYDIADMTSPEPGEIQ